MPIELSRLYSHQKFLGKGVGQRLLEECFRFAGSEGFDVIWLGVWEYNPRARRFYEKNGFRYVGSHIFQLGTDAQTDLLMQK
ncbi:GNAT family N-acetyltransferase, partial [Escherichia coli]|nr:GNAT family N-acetyltransferase [Escherichia coli]